MNSKIIKNHIASSFKTLALNDSISKITVAAICQEANISRRNFYNHFKDKYDLMQWIYLSEILDYEDQIPCDLFEEYIWNRFYLTCHYFQSQRAYYLNVLSDKSQNSFYQLMLDILTDHLESVFGTLYKGNTYSSKLISNLVVLNFEEAYNWLKTPSELSPEDFCHYMRKTTIEVNDILSTGGLQGDHKKVKNELLS